MGKVTVVTNAKEEFKPIEISIKVKVESLSEYNELKDSLRELDEDFPYESALLERIINELYTTIQWKS